MSLNIPNIDFNEIQDLGSLHHYRTEIPNIIFHMKLDPWVFKAYCVFKMTAGDKGSCFKSNLTLSDEIGCSLPTIIKLKTQLQEQGLINIIKRKHENGGDMPDLIHIVDIWPQNMEYMAKLYPKNPKNDHFMFVRGGKPDLVGGVNAIKGGSKPGLYKQDHKEQEQKEQQQQPPAAAFSEKVTNNTISYECLKDLNIPESDKIEISSMYTKDCVEKAILWAKNPQTKISKGLAPAIKWACKSSPEIPKDPVDEQHENKEFAEDLEHKVKKLNGIYFEALNKHALISFDAQKEPICVNYDAKGFKELLIKHLTQQRLI